jgi:hypothetical protein
MARKLSISGPDAPRCTFCVSIGAFVLGQQVDCVPAVCVSIGTCVPVQQVLVLLY